jgi:hypothetical protein
MTIFLQALALNELLLCMSKSRYSNGVSLTKMTNKMKSANPGAVIQRIRETMAKKEDLHLRATSQLWSPAPRMKSAFEARLIWGGREHLFNPEE